MNESQGKKIIGLSDRIELERGNQELKHRIEQLNTQVEQLNTLHEIGRSVAATQEPDVVLTRIVEAAVSITKAEEGTLMLLDPQTDELYVRAQKGLDEEFAQMLRLKVSDSLAGRVLTTSKPIRYNRKCKVMTGYMAKAIIYVPVIYKNETLGILSVDNQKTEAPFSEDDEYLLRGLADYAAIAIKNTSLVENLRSRNYVLTSLHKTSHSMLAALTLNKVLSQIVGSALEVLKADVIVLYQYNKKEDDIIVPPIFQGEVRAPKILKDRGRVVQHEQSAVFKMVRRGRSFYAPNAQVDWTKQGLLGTSHRPGEDSFIARESIKSSAGIILMADNEIVGVMFVNCRTPHPFVAEEKEIIEIFANQAAIAIQHARLFDQQQKQMEQEKTLLRTLEVISSPLKLEDVSEKILDGVGQIVEYRRASLQLVHGDIRTLLTGRGFEVKTADPRFHRKISDDRLISRVVTSKTPLILSETTQDPDWGEYPATADVKSWIGIPLVYVQEVIGLLTLDHDQAGFYTPAFTDMLALFAHQAAIDLQKAYLFDSAQERIRHLEIINQVAQIMTTQLDTKDLLETIVAQITEWLQCTHCAIFFPQQENSELVLAPQVVKGEGEAQVKSRRFKSGEGLVGWVFQHGQSLMPIDATKDTRFAPARRKQGKPRSLLIVPIKSGDQTIGVISADQDERAWFNESGRRLVEALALQAGIAIERNIGLELLRDIGNRIVSLQDVDLILQEIACGAIKLTHTTTGVIYLISEDGQSVVKSFYPPGFSHPRPRLDKKEGLTRQVIATGEVLRIDVRNDPRVNPVLRALFQSMIAVPLKLEQKVIGVLYLNDENSHTFTETEVSMLLTLASQAAIAIEQARLDELTALYDTSLDIARQADVGSVLQSILRRAVELVGAQGGGILLTYPREREVRMAFTLNLDEMRNFTCKFGEGMAGHVAETRQPLIVDDYQTWPHRIPSLGEEPYRHVLKAMAMAPLNWKDEVIGMLFVSDSRPDKTFSQRDQKILEHLTSLAALAIGNTREHAYMQNLVAVSPDAIIAADRQGYITQFNEASERILGFTLEEVLGQHVAQYYWAGETEARQVNHLLVEAGPAGLKDYETLVKGKGGEKIPIRLAGKVLRDETGRRIGSFGVMMDLRERTTLLKNQVENDFLATLEHIPQDQPIRNLADLRQRLTQQLDMTRRFCQTEYLVLFASIKEEETILPAIAGSGLPKHVEDNLPHFSWRKAGLQPEHGNRDQLLRYEADLITAWEPDQSICQRMLDGIRGGAKEFFAQAAYIIPLRLADNYRSVLIFGPFTDEMEVMSNADFLKSVNLTISTSALSWLQALYLRTRQNEAQTTAKLITHRTLMNLQQVNGKFGIIKRLAADKSPTRVEATEGEKIVELLSRSVRTAFTSGVIDMEPENYSFQSYSLATLVQNCIEGFREQAEKQHNELRIDPSVENLPYAEVDPTMLSIALGNLVDNALKYSFDDTYIHVKAEHYPRTARIIITDVGGPMPEEARTNLRQPGRRWTVSAGARRIPGMGLGLWEANIIANVHGGEVSFSAIPFPKRGKKAYLVSVWLELSLKLP